MQSLKSEVQPMHIYIVFVSFQLICLSQCLCPTLCLSHTLPFFVSVYLSLPDSLSLPVFGQCLFSLSDFLFLSVCQNVSVCL